MFLFLSKILPLFLYPLGLACLLLFIALIISWKQLSWSQLPIALALIVLLVSSNGWTQNFLVRSLEGQNIPIELPNADAIVLLGGATKSATKPRPMVDVSEQGDRVLYAAKLYLEKKAPIIIASGGRIDWNSAGQPEAADMAQLLEMMGVPKDAIVQEPDSLNTYQNAVNVKKILDEKGIQKILLVTSALHMPRSLLIFQRQKIEAIAAPTDFLVSEPEMEIPSSSLGAIVLNLLPDSGRLEITTKVIKEYIGTIIYRLKGW
nr:YdcF family protein [Hydrococcus sp. Prado102]